MVRKNIKEKNNKGFTLMELIIVVAILAILVGILAPQYTKYVEKSRRSADMHNAKEIEKVLQIAMATEDIQIPANKGKYYGVWVMICKNKSNAYAPDYYHGKQFEGIWCGADEKVVINGVSCNNAGVPNEQLKKILQDAGLSNKNFQTRSSSDKSKNSGWDWIIIQVGYDKNGNDFSRIYSGFKDQNGSINQTNYTTNIEKLMYGTK